MPTNKQLVIRIQSNVSMPFGCFESIRDIVKPILKMKVGDSFSINYMMWARISNRVNLVAKVHGIKLISRRERGDNVKNTRVWRSA